MTAALRAEWTKFRTVRGWVAAMVAAALLPVLIGVWASTGGQPCGLVEPGGQTVSRACPVPPAGPGGEAVTDSFYLVRRPLAGDGSLTVRVTALSGGTSADGQGRQFAAGLQPWAKAGIIVAASTRPGSAYAAMMVTGGHGTRMQYDYTGDTPGLPGAVSPGAPRWLRLVRSGDTLAGYDSADGAHWALVGTATLAGLPATAQAGLFVASPDAVHAESGSPTLATAVFDHVSAPGAGWRGSQVDPGPGGGPQGGFRQAGGRFTVQGSGDIAPAVANAESSAKPADHALAGVFAGLIVVTVVGAMFMTAEYRRGLIRTTLAASPARGRVLAAKAAVTGSVTFAAGLAAAAVAVPLGEHLMRGKGVYVFPMGGLTEARVVAGTAALLALAAVLALALGAVTRHGAWPVTAVVALMVLPYFFASPLALLPPSAAGWLLRLTPAAGFAAEQVLPQYPQVSNSYTAQYGYYPLGPWGGLAVLACWTALALAAAAVTIHRRDA